MGQIALVYVDEFSIKVLTSDALQTSKSDIEKANY